MSYIDDVLKGTYKTREQEEEERKRREEQERIERSNTPFLKDVASRIGKANNAVRELNDEVRKQYNEQKQQEQQERLSKLENYHNNKRNELERARNLSNEERITELEAIKKQQNNNQRTYSNENNKINNPLDFIREGAIYALPTAVSIALPESYKKLINTNSLTSYIKNLKDTRSKYWDNGYQFGDVTKTIGEDIGTVANVAGSTIGDMGYNVIKGAQGLGEGINDKILYLVADIEDGKGNKEVANRIRERAKRNEWQEWTKDFEDTLNKNSLAGEYIDEAMQGAGYSTLLMGISLLGGGSKIASTALSSGTTYASASGNAYTEALNSGATPEEAKLYSKISAGGEVITEMLFGGIAKFGNAVGVSKGLGSLDDELAKKLTKNINSQVTKNLIQYGVKSAGEGVEEILSGLVNAVGKKISYMNKKDLWKLIEDEKLLDSFIVGTLSSTLSQAPGLVSATKQGINFVDDLPVSNQENTYANRLKQQAIEEKQHNEILQQENPLQQIQNKNNQLNQAKEIDITPVANESNRFENRVKQQAIEEINKSNISTEEKQQMIQALDEVGINNESQLNELRQMISTTDNNNLPTQRRSFEDIVDEAMSNVEYKETTSPLQNRNINTIGKETNVNAYQYENPEVKPYYKQMAEMILQDVENVSDKVNRSTAKGGGTTLNINTSAIKTLHNEMGYSYSQIREGLNKIIEDHGQENNALSKKIEIIIDDQLRNGYKNSYNQFVDANEGYINLVNQKTDNIAPTANDTLPVVNEKYSMANQEQTTRSTAEKYSDRFESKTIMNKIVSQLERIAEIRNKNNKGHLDILFDDTIQGNGIIEIDGDNRTIRLNPASNKAVEFTLIHELSHDLKGTEGYGALVELVKEYNDGKINYQDAFNDIKNMYESYYKQNGLDLSKLDINEEAVNDILGTALGTQEFVNKLFQKERKGFYKIYDWIKKQIAIYKSENKELTRWLYKVEDTFKEAIRQQNNLKDGKKLRIIYNDDGTFNRVKITDNIFENNNGKSITKTIEDYLIDHIGEYADIIESGQRVYLGEDLPSEYAFSKDSQSLTPAQKLAKGRATSGIKEIIETATNREYSNKKKPKHIQDAKYGFYKYDTKFSFEQNGREHIYTGTILIRNDADGKKYLYDILNIKKIGSDLLPVASNSQESSAKIGSSNNLPTNSIPSSNENVNTTKYSIQNSENNTDNQGRALTKEQQNRFKNSKARNDNGQLETVYHGSNKAGFTVFNKNWNFYTNNKEMAQTYSRSNEIVDTKKLESLSDAKSWLKGITDEAYIEKNSVYDEYGKQIFTYKTEEELLRNLKRDIQKEFGDVDAGGIYQGYVNIEKPVIIDANNEIWSKIDIDNISIDGIDNIKDFLYKYGSSVFKEDGKTRTSTSDIVSAIESAIDEGEIDADGVIIKNIYDEGGYGNITPTESGTDYITFNSNQFKAIDNTNPTSDPDIRYSISDNQNDRLSKLNENFDLTVKVRDDLYDQRDELQKQYDELTQSQEYKEAYKRLVKMTDMSKVESTQEYEFVKKAQNIKNKINDIQDEIDIATSDIRRISENIEKEEKQHRTPEESIKQAKKELGLTNNFKEAGYMLQDGSLLDFSGRSQGSNAYNQRTMDHREINQFGYDMNEFIDLGNIRMQPESNGFELMKEPTEQQYNKLKEYIDKANGEVYIDIYKNSRMGTYDTADYKPGTSTSKIINDLQYYFKNGKFPTKSEFSEFLYSQTKEGTWNNYLDKLDNDLSKDNKRTKTYFTAPKSGEIDIAERAKKGLDPIEISKLTPEDASTTPKLKERKYTEGNKQSSFFRNITQDSQFLNEDVRQMMTDEDNIRYYKGITNQESLEKAYKSLQDGGAKATNEWFMKDDKNSSAEDIAKGWILLKQYQENGDSQGQVEVAKKMRSMLTNAGQTVQMANLLSRLTPEGMFYYAQSELSEAYNKMVEGKSKKWIEANQDKFNLTPEETQFIKDTMEDVSQMEDGREKQVKLAEIQKLVQDKLPPTVGQGIKAWMRISMLLNPKTLHRNILGNEVVLPVNMASDVFASGLDKLISKKTGVRTTGNINLKNYAKGFKQGLFESYDDFRKGINTRDIQGNKFEIGEGKSFKDKGLGKALNKLDSVLNFALDAGDRPFYEATFTNSINNQLVLNNTTEVTQDMIDIATNEALQRTWQDNNKYTESVLKIRNILNNVNVKGYGLGDVIIPFAKTPANLTKAIVDYSPVGLTKTLAMDARKFKNSLQNGQYSPQLQHKFVQDLGKGMAGSLLYVLAYGLAKAGIATGESDDDKDVKNFMRNSLGINNYSIKIGDKTFTYDWAQPVATPLAIMTNFVKYSKDNPDANIIEKGINAMNIGTEQLLQQSFMESLNTVLNGSGTTLENLSKAVLDLPARAIPTFSKQIADMVDGTQRTSFEYDKPLESALNSVKAKIPGLSTTLPASVDTLGNEIQKYGGDNNIWNVMFNPANVNTGKLSKAGKEIYDLYTETGDKTIFPRVAPYYINSKGEKINMDATQRNKFQTTSGKYVENAVNSLLNDKNYTSLSNDQKAKVINDIVTDSYNKAKYDVLNIDSDAYAKQREVLKDVSAKNYYDYKIQTEGMNKDVDKINVLTNSNYTRKEKQALYETYIKSSNDILYDTLKASGININEYLNYKQQNFESDKTDDGTINGKSISGSKKQKVYNYVNNMNISYMQKLLLLGTQYKLDNNQRSTLANYINSLSISKQKKLDMYSKLSGFTVYKDGGVSW